MTATLLSRVMELEHPRLTSTEIVDRFLIEDFKVKPCPFGAGCKQDPANCPFRHPDEKGRRDLRRFVYSSYPCKWYGLNSGSCPEGDNCDSAHGFWGLEEYLKEEDMVDERLKKAGHLHPHPADASERNAIELILDLKSNGQIHGYKSYFTQQVDACVPDSCIDVASYELAVARAVSHGISKHYPDMNISTSGIFKGNLINKIVNGGITAHGDASILTPASSRYPVPQQGLFSTSNKLFLKHNKDIAVSPAEERVEPLWAQPQLLSALDAPPMTGGSSVPKDPNSSRLRRPIYFDSGASVHVASDEWMLQGYQVLAEPWRIAVADGRPLDVVGIGNISLEDFMIPKVYHVQGLQMNLVSVSQLDRDHGLFSGFHDSMCKVLKRGGDVIGGGFLQANGLYELSFLQVPDTEILQAPETEILQAPDTEILQAPETETGEEAGSVIQAIW